MTLQNFCIECGQRIYPNQGKCPNCNTKTKYVESNNEYFIDIPIYTVGFFNFSIDFSPIIKNYRTDYDYSICSCGYINHKNNEFCYNCGKKINGKLSKFFKQPYKLKSSAKTIFCDSCMEQLLDGIKKFMFELNNKDLSNFNHIYFDSNYCFCGAENNPKSEFCYICNAPLKKIEKSDNYRVYCSCGTINNAENNICINCSSDLLEPNKHLICVCGTINEENAKLCSNCNRVLSKDRNIPTKLICKCGAILDYETHYCPFCGNSIGKYIDRIRNNQKL